VSIFLLDVNVLLALFWPPHQSHERAQNWFKRYAGSGWATCPFTESAFIRIVSNPQLSPYAPSPLQAEETLYFSLNHPYHYFWPDELTVRDAIAPLRENIVGHRQITDAYLLGLTIFHRGKLATLDSGISSLLPADSLRPNLIEQL